MKKRPKASNLNVANSSESLCITDFRRRKQAKSLPQKEGVFSMAYFYRRVKNETNLTVLGEDDQLFVSATWHRSP